MQRPRGQTASFCGNVSFRHSFRRRNLGEITTSGGNFQYLYDNLLLQNKNSNSGLIRLDSVQFSPYKHSCSPLISQSVSVVVHQPLFCGIFYPVSNEILGRETGFTSVFGFTVDVWCRVSVRFANEFTTLYSQLLWKEEASWSREKSSPHMEWNKCSSGRCKSQSAPIRKTVRVK